MDDFIIRDMRKKEKYFMDDEYLNGYAKLCGVYATGVYCSLCRHSNKEQTCFPSNNLIARELDINEKTVRKSLKALVFWNIIKIVKGKRKKSGFYAPNKYTLLDKTMWKLKPTVTDTAGANGSSSQSPEVFEDKHQGYEVPHKDTHSNDTNNNDSAETSSANIAALIRVFEAVNPACATYYGNTTQRKACAFLIDTYSFDRVKVIVEKTLPQTNGKEFFPTITTPLQLQEKWAMLESAVKRHITKNRTQENSSVAF